MRCVWVAAVAWAGVACAAGAALAEPKWDAQPVDFEILEVLGGHGCTLGEASAAALSAEGYPFEAVQLVALQAQATGQATSQGVYVVLDQSICTIRLPDIQSEWAIDSPEIQTTAPYMRQVFEYDGEQDVYEGCFLDGALALFDKFYAGDAEAANAAYLKFLAAHVMSGEARFYATSPLVTPLSFQIVSGECARAPNVDDINASHGFIASGFEAYVRFLGENSVCGEDTEVRASQFSAQLQGGVLDEGYDYAPGINAWLFFEMDLITMAAGWHEGLGATSRGEPRPPLCHYPD